MPELFDFIRQHFAIISTLSMIIIGAFWLKLDSKYAKKSDLNALAQRCDQQVGENEHRITLLETKVDNLPTAQDVARLEVLMTEIKGETKSTNTQMGAMSHQVALLIEAKVLHKEKG